MAKASATSMFTAAGLKVVPTESSTPAWDFDELLDLAVEKEASDIHFGATSKIALRIFGEIRFVETAGVLDQDTAERLIIGLIKNKTKQQELFQKRELDFSYQHSDGTVFHCNAFFRRGHLSIVMRRIPKSIPTLDQLGLPPAVKMFCQSRQGFLLVCGPANSGKSVTISAILEQINESRVAHVVTIEDPIKYLFTDKQCIFSQRELYSDASCFDAAMRATLRQDSNIVMIDKMRDQTTLNAAMDLCESGNLVLSTLNATSASQTIKRLVQSVGVDQREPMLCRIADNLVGIISQRLLPKVGGGLVGVYEVMIANKVIREAISQGQLTKLNSIITNSEILGMVNMHKFAEALVERGVVSPDSLKLIH